jgi:hypothetical protein
VGYCALKCNTTGVGNIGLGDRALSLNTTGANNTAVGRISLYRNTTGIANTGLGYGTLVNNTTGVCNTAVGFNSLRYNISGTRNTAVGNNSLIFNTTGNNNTSVGFYSLFSNTASNNTAVGYCALRYNTTGNRNVAVGTLASRCNTTGGYNASLGYGALSSSNTGFSNTAVGFCALFSASGGASCNTALGFNAQHLNGNSNTIAVGFCAVTNTVSNHTVWGNSANNVCNCVYAAWSNVSDCRDKTNIQTLPSKLGLDLITKLRPVSFNWDHRDTYVRECSYEYGQKDGNLAGTKEHYGLIAQELKSALEELDVKFDGLGHDDNKNAYRLTYEELIAPIIKAIQEQQIQIESLKSENDTIKSEIEILKQK